MKLPPLGPLHIEDPRSPTTLISEPIAVPYFDGKKLPFRCWDLSDADEAETLRAVEAFLRKTSRDREAVSEAVYKNFCEINEAVDGGAGCEIGEARDVWNFIDPRFIDLRRDRGAGPIYVQILAECGWEPEHGLQLIYRGGEELTRVSGQDGELTD